MPHHETDCLQPPLGPAEQKIVNSYGGWTQFLICFGLKPWKDGHEEAGMRILRAFAADDGEDTE